MEEKRTLESYFRFDTVRKDGKLKNRGTCVECSCVVIYSTNRSNLYRHVRTKHNPVFDQPSSESQAVKITDYFATSIKAIFDVDILKLIVMDYHPLSIAESKYFASVAKIQNIPSAETLKLHLLQLYQYNKQMFNTLVFTLMFMSFTTDTWTSIGRKNFAAITYHLLNENFELQCGLFDIIRVTGGQTGQNLSDTVLDTITDTFPNVVAVTTGKLSFCSIVSSIILMM